MPDSPVTTISFFQYSGLRKRYAAFTRMGLLPFRIRKDPQLQFAKLLGSGAGNGFSLRPDFGTYAFLATWNSKDQAEHFFQSSSIFQQIQEPANQSRTIFLQAVKSHGAWDGQQPFVCSASLSKSEQIAVLTRATIRPGRLIEFWKHVPQISKAIEGREGLVFSKGIGELPLVQQATFSIWKNRSAMVAYAYEDQPHREIIKKTRARGWYKEELFAEFRVLENRRVTD